MLPSIWLALCLTCIPVVAAAQPVFQDSIRATLTHWSTDQSWQYGGFEVRVRFPNGLGASSYGSSSFWLRSTRAGAGQTYGEIAVFAPPDAAYEDEEYEAIIEAWAPAPNIRATRELSIYAERLSGEWHDYAVQWNRGLVVWYLDGQPVARVTWTPGDGSPWSVLDDEVLTPVLDTDFAHPMEIDVVRVWAR